jgi:hypothetical protein
MQYDVGQLNFRKGNSDGNHIILSIFAPYVALRKTNQIFQ